MGKIKILVVEDEIVIADDICDILSDLGYEALEPVINYTEALEAIETFTPDLAILDIQLAGSKDGIDLAWKIKEDYDLPYIFLTSNADPSTVERAKKVVPPAYLVKPFNKDDLYTSIELAIYNYSNAKKGGQSTPSATSKDDIIIKDAFFVKTKNLFQKVKFADILFIRVEHVYTELHTTGKNKHVIRGSLTDLCEKLPENFFRTHRSYAVNLDHLDAINHSDVIIGDQKIPIGKNYRAELLQRIDIK